MDLLRVVISIYRPDIRFLVRQLETVECQDYENIEVIIRDDDPGSAFDESIL